MRWTFALAALLMGCQSNTDGSPIIGLPGSPAWMATASPEAKAEHFGKACAAYGFKAGTPEMASCIQSEVSGQRTANAVLRPQIRQPVTCRSYGNLTTCQ